MLSSWTSCADAAPRRDDPASRIGCARRAPRGSGRWRAACAEAGRACFGLAANRELGFVRLHNLAKPAQRLTGTRRGHRKADTVPKVPRGFHAASKHPLKLPGADAFLAGAKQVDGLQPQVQRQVTILEDRTHAHGERLAAGVALAQAENDVGCFLLGLERTPSSLPICSAVAPQCGQVGPFGQSWAST